MAPLNAVRPLLLQILEMWTQCAENYIRIHLAVFFLFGAVAGLCWKVLPRRDDFPALCSKVANFFVARVSRGCEVVMEIVAATR